MKLAVLAVFVLAIGSLSLADSVCKDTRPIWCGVHGKSICDSDKFSKLCQKTCLLCRAPLVEVDPDCKDDVPNWCKVHAITVCHDTTTDRFKKMCKKSCGLCSMP